MIQLLFDRCDVDECLADRCRYKACGCSCHRYPFAEELRCGKPNESLGPPLRLGRWFNLRVVALTLALYALLALLVGRGCW